MKKEEVIVIAMGAFGTFFGNWVIVPLISNRSWTDGFAIGIIAAIIFSFLMTLALLWKSHNPV